MSRKSRYHTSDFLLSWELCTNSDSAINLTIRTSSNDDIERNDKNVIVINNKKCVFDLKEYNHFCINFAQDFNVEYPYSSTLVLMEYLCGNFSTTRKMIF